MELPFNGRACKKMADIMNSFNDYRRKTERVIPVIVLTSVK